MTMPGRVRDLDELERAGGGASSLGCTSSARTAKRGLKDAAGADADRDAGLRREPRQRDAAGWVARGEARLRLSRRTRRGAGRLRDGDRARPDRPKAWENKAHVLSEHLNKPADAVRCWTRQSNFTPTTSWPGRAAAYCTPGSGAAPPPAPTPTSACAATAPP